MEANPVLFRDLTYIFLAALAGGLIAWRLRLPLILGFVIHTNRGAMPEVLEPPVRSARDRSNPGARQTGKQSTETRTSRLR